MMRRTLDRPVLVTLFSSLWWCTISLMTAANQVAQDDDTWDKGLFDSFSASAPWVPITVGIFAMCRRVPIRRAGLARALAIHSMAALGVVLARAAYIYALNPWVHWYAKPPAFWLVLLHSGTHNFPQYFLLAGVAHAVIYRREAIARAERETELASALGRAELAALAATLHPHFLFNTLQSIAEMVHRDADAADRMLVGLSRMLRRLLDDRRALVPLGDELAFARDYLALEQVRFGDRLDVKWEVDTHALRVPVPRLSVQPLVENAIRHGLWPAGRPGTLVVKVTRSEHDLVVSIADDGVGVLRAPVAAAGHGLASVRARVELVYGGGGEVVLAPRASGGAEALVRIPCGVACVP